MTTARRWVERRKPVFLPLIATPVRTALLQRRFSLRPRKGGLTDSLPAANGGSLCDCVRTSGGSMSRRRALGRDLPMRQSLLPQAAGNCFCSVWFFDPPLVNTNYPLSSARWRIFVPLPEQFPSLQRFLVLRHANPVVGSHRYQGSAHRPVWP